MFHVKHKLEKVETCPLCGHKEFTHHLSCVDHNYSNDLFDISSCNNCSFKFTNPRPTSDTIHKYYISDHYISHTSSKKGLFNKVYHLVRNYQFGYKYRLIKKSHAHVKDISLLDFGCGTGEFLNYCYQKGMRCQGVEKDDGARNMGISNFNLSILKRLEEVESKKEKFDVITLWHVLEHIKDFKLLLTRLKELLNENGILILGLPNHNSLDAQIFKENWVAYDVPIHLSHFSQNNMKDLVSHLSFKSISTKPLFFDAYYISLLSAKKKGKSFLFGLKSGVMSNRKAKKTSEYSSLAYIIKN